MTTKICATCHQDVPDTLPLPQRIRVLLMGEDGPVPAKYIRAQLGGTAAVMYQTLRRMVDRGDIRKSTIHGFGSGYVLAEPVEEATPSPTQDDVMADRLMDLLAYVNSQQAVKATGARDFLVRMGVSAEDAVDLVNAAVQTGALLQQGDWVTVAEL